MAFPAVTRICGTLPGSIDNFPLPPIEYRPAVQLTVAIKMTNRAFFVAAVILGLAATAAKAEDPQKLFDQLYGDEARKVGNDAKASAVFGGIVIYGRVK
jgi:hypothetical protein